MRTSRGRARAVPTLLAGALFFAACGSDDSSSTAGAPSTKVPTTGAATADSEPPVTDAASGTVATDTGSPVTEPVEGEPYEGEVGVDDETIKIGLFLPETGLYAVGTTDKGTAIFNAGFTAVNAAGGIHGRDIELVLYDDGSGDPAVTQDNFKDARDEVFATMAIIGDTSTTLSQLGEQAEVPSVLGAVDGRVARENMWSFAAYPYWDESSRLMDDYILSVADTETPIGVLYMASPNGEGAYEAFMEEADAAGLNVVVEQPIDVFPSTCSNEVSVMQDAGVEMLYIISASLPAICMIRGAREAGYEPDTWLSCAHCWNLDLVAKAVDRLPENSVAFGWTTTLETEAGEEFSEVVHEFVPEATEKDVDINALIGYAPGQLLLAGLEAAGPNLTRDGFREAMETSVSGVETGYGSPPVFGPGDRSGPLSVSLWGPGTRIADGEEVATWVTLDPIWRDEF